MIEKRGSERRLVDRLLRVTEHKSNATVGRLVNLSPSGFMLISETPLTPDRRERLMLELPYEVEGKRSVELEATCIWCEPSGRADDYGAGFQIDSMSEEDRRTMQSVFGAP